MPEAETLLMTLSFAEGSVDPTERIERGEIDSQKGNELVGRLRNREFITDADPKAIPCDCMDCRGQSNGQAVVGPKAAGGTMTCVMGDALTTDSYRHPGEKAPEHKRRVLTELKKLGHKVGGHIGAPGYGGCGAEGKLDNKEPDAPSILSFIGRKAPAIFGTLRTLGYEVEPELEAGISAKATQLRHEGYATSGEELAQVGKEVAGEENVRELEGQQQGVVVVVLTRPGEILDQSAIRKEYGDEYEVFEIAAWSIANGANATSINPEEEHQKLIAGLAYNLAAGGVIAGPGMPIVIL